MNEIAAKAVPLDSLLGLNKGGILSSVADLQHLRLHPVATSAGDAVNRPVPSELFECLIARMLNTAAIIKITITRMS